ncbi:MFS transporter [Photobacterium atrarenae]|uniref:MFS transporter n=1 Tax=Photobacterium atrarenae TaxID=865757 RepID=A0ABY5GBS1_9GAMM|nr:MFS transporter [Photobacterium atrarenae]UTV26645.1 MFS transporter [Photobacterium atrarenae]
MREDISELAREESFPLASRLALVGLAMGLLLSSFNISVVNVALPDLANRLAVSMPAVQWLVVTYLLAMTCLMPMAGWWGDRWGRKPVMLSGICIFSLGTIGCVLAESLTPLIMARLVQGVGAALMISLAMTFVSDLLPASKTGLAMGVLGTTSAVGTALGPVLGGLLITYFHWHALFYVSLPVSILSFLISARQLPDRRSVAPSSVPQGHLWHHLRESTGLQRSCGANFLVSAVIMSTMVVGPFYLSDGIGLTTEQIGLVMAFGPVVAAVTGAPAGKLTDNRGPGFVIRTGLVVMLSGCLLIALLSIWGLSFPGAAAFGYVVPLVMITAGYAMFQAANNTLVMKNVQEGRKGVTSALLNLSRNLGLMAGASVLGWVYLVAMAVAPTGQPQSVVAFAVTFVVSAGLVMLALSGMVRKRT